MITKLFSDLTLCANALPLFYLYAHETDADSKSAEENASLEDEMLKKDQRHPWWNSIIRHIAGH